MRTTGRSFARGFRQLVGDGRRRAGEQIYGLSVLATAVTGALLMLGLAPATGSGAGASSPTSAAVTIVRELPELRSETSDTFLRSDGSRMVKISRTPVNYRDSSGNWQPISTTLQPGPGGSLSSTATILPASLPASLSAPVTVGSDGQTVSFALEGAGGTASSNGSTASYAEALPNVKASYEEQPTRLSETLSLANASAPSVYRYHLSTTGGVTAKLLDGAVIFSDAQGHPRYVMPPPTVTDAGATGRPDSKDVHYTLSEDGSQLDVVVDSAWLSSPERAFPVTIDPTTEYFGDSVDCFIASEPPGENESLCGWYLYLGSHPYGTGGHSIGRGLLRFNLGSSIPQDSVILSANLNMTNDYTASSTQTIEVQALKKTPTNSATWNKYDGTNAWENKGGDFEAAKPAIKREIAPSESGHLESWGISTLVEKWVREPETNHGIIVKAENEAPGSGESAWESDSGSEHPYIEVIYEPRIGTPNNNTLLSQSLSDRQGLSVNVANGNLLLQNHILELPGIGYDLSINQYYNSESYNYPHALGLGAGLSTAADVRIEQNASDGSWDYIDPSGAIWRFDREPAGDKEGNKAFTIPSGLNAKLEEHENGTLTLEYITARVKYQFGSTKFPSYLLKIEDANKNTTTFHYNSEGTESIEDTHGHTVSFKYSPTTHHLSTIKDALGRTWEFTDNSSNELETTKDPDGHKSKYTYEGERLTQIEDPDGHLIELRYDSYRRLKEIRHVVNGTATTPGTKDVITTFAYTLPATSSLECPPGTIGSTEVVSPDGSPEGKADSSSTGHKTFYCFNNQDEVTKTIDQAGNPSTASYDPLTGNLTTYQNPGDMAEGGGGSITNTIAYEPSGAVKEVTTGTTGTSSLRATFAYGGGSEVLPSSAQTPFSAPKQKSESTHQTFYGYDSSGNLSSVRQDHATESEAKAEAKLVHNSKGQVEESVDANKHKTTYTYTEGNLTKITPESPLGATTLTYDAVGRVHTVEDGRKNIATYTYDGEDRVTKVEYSDGSYVTFKYDADGNTVERVDAKSFGEPYTGAALYEYDKLNRPILETTPTGKSIRYGYDYDGNLTSLEDKGGTVSYSYGPDDVLTGLTEPENSSHPFKFGYEKGDDNRESTSYPNGLLQCTKTDPAGRLTKFMVFKPSAEQSCASSVTPSSTLEDYELEYTFKEEVEPGVFVTIDTPDLQTLKNLKAGNATAYTYETLDRLLKAVTKAGTESATLTSEYEYDKAGNMKLNHTFSPSTTYSNEHMLYNAANEICAIATSAPSACPSEPTEEGIAGKPTYDKDGDMTSDGALGGAAKFAYTVRDQLSSITPNGESAKQIVSHGTGEDDLAAIGSEEVITDILGVSVTGSGESAKYYTRGSEGALLAKRTAKGKPSETEYIALEPFGSVSMLTNSSGTQTAPSSGSYQYDPYGSPVGTTPTTFGYHAAQLLPDGLAHFGARDYDPAVGSWTQQDPVNQIASLAQADRFTYASDSPIDAVDPSGSLTISFTIDAGPVEAGLDVDTEGHVGGHVGIGPAEELGGEVSVGGGSVDTEASVNASGCIYVCVGGSHGLKQHSPRLSFGVGVGGGAHLSETQRF
jgi:RHS repeat-associated protein